MTRLILLESSAFKIFLGGIFVASLLESWLIFSGNYEDLRRFFSKHNGQSFVMMVQVCFLTFNTMVKGKGRFDKHKYTCVLCVCVYN